ncbi:hypothetical protein RYR31_002380 [Aeromonas dhakensis]|nr:hypothetical protein [Aeromonas dhakensis]
MGFQLPPNMQLVRFERLNATTDEGKQIFELALVDHYAKRVVYYNKAIVLLHAPEIMVRPFVQLLTWRTPAPAYKSVISGVADRVFTDYLLENYQIVMSDSHKTGHGPLFWERQVLVALSHRLYVYYYQMDKPLQYIPNKESLENHLEVLRCNGDNLMHHVAIISKKPIQEHLTFYIAEDIS